MRCLLGILSRNGLGAFAAYGFAAEVAVGRYTWAAPTGAPVNSSDDSRRQPARVPNRLRKTHDDNSQRPIPNFQAPANCRDLELGIGSRRLRDGRTSATWPRFEC